MADYIDALAQHHGGPSGGQADQGAFVHDLMRAHEIELLQPLLDAVSDRNDMRLIGPSDATRRAPTVAVALDRPGREVAADLAPHGIMAGGGDFYAGRALSAMGVAPHNGVLRLSFTHYTTKNEVTRLIEALDQVV